MDLQESYDMGLISEELYDIATKYRYNSLLQVASVLSQAKEPLLPVQIANEINVMFYMSGSKDYPVDTKMIKKPLHHLLFENLIRHEYNRFGFDTYFKTSDLINFVLNFNPKTEKKRYKKLIWKIKINKLISSFKQKLDK